jgi:hypothetical protein
LKNWKGIVGICLVFILGMMAGGVITAGFVQNRIRHVVEGGPDAVSELIVRRLNRELRLDAAQRAQLESIVRGARQEIKGIRRGVQPQIDQSLGRAEQQVRLILQPAQVKKFDEIVLRARSKWQRPD